MQVVEERNALPSACGRICTHPCETECRRNSIDKPIAIAWLKRFLADGYFHEAAQGNEVQAETRYSEKIAIIGAGPAGLAAAVAGVAEAEEVAVFVQEHGLEVVGAGAAGAAAVDAPGRTEVVRVELDIGVVYL